MKSIKETVSDTEDEVGTWAQEAQKSHRSLRDLQSRAQAAPGWQAQGAEAPLNVPRVRFSEVQQDWALCTSTVNLNILSCHCSTPYTHSLNKQESALTADCSRAK